MNTLIRNIFTHNDIPKRYEVITGESMTLPDQTMSLKEILERYTHGLSSLGGGLRVPLYSDDPDNDDGIDFEHLDLADQEAIIEARKVELAELKRKTQTTASPDKTRTRKTPAGEASAIEEIEPISETKDIPPKEVEK